MRLQSGRVAVVTGAASGIGLALASAAAEAGLNLVLSDIDDVRLETAAQTLRPYGVTVETIAGDVSDPSLVDRIADAAFALGSVQLVCSNAGIVVPGRVWEISQQDWHRVLDVNLWPTIHVFRAFIPRLIAAGEPAHLLVTGSMASVTARAGIGPYVASKHALLGLAETTFHELRQAEAPIGVTILMPGLVVTGMAQKGVSMPSALSSEQVAAIALDAVSDDRLFAFTHPERVPEVKRRFAAIVAGQAPEAP
ncbi:SDR family NAD(P)-dependent oxidoreductase [Jatrophihabitans sp. DSM 45814]